MYHLLNCVGFTDETLAKVIRFSFHFMGCDKYCVKFFLRGLVLYSYIYTRGNMCVYIYIYILILSSKGVDMQYVYR